MMDTSAGFLPEIKDKEGEGKWLEFLKTLRNVTEGKVCPAVPSADHIGRKSRGHGEENCLADDLASLVSLF
jgi:hypothetical protein